MKLEVRKRYVAVFRASLRVWESELFIILNAALGRSALVEFRVVIIKLEVINGCSLFSLLAK